MSLHDVAQHLASQGRYGDDMLVHMNPKEVAGLQALAHQKGTSLTTNPQTGMPEAFSLGDLNPFRIVQGKGEIGESGLGSLLIGAALNAAFPGMSALQAGLLTGGATLAMGGNLRQSIGQGLGAYGGASMMGGPATAANPNSVPVPDAVATPVAPAAAPIQAPVSTTPQFDFATDMGGPAAVSPTQAAAQVPTTTPPPVNIGFGPNQYQPTTEMTPMGQVGQFVKDYKYPLMGAGALALLNEKPEGAEAPERHPGFIRPYIYDPQTQGLTQLRPVRAPGYAMGGPVEAMSNANAIGMNTGYPQADITGHAYATPWQTPVSQNVVTGSADTGVDRMTGQMFAEGGVTGSGNLNLNIPLNLGGQSGPNEAYGYKAAGSGDGSSFNAPSVSGGMFSQAGAGGFGQPMDSRMMQGGFDPRAISANPQGFQQMMQMAQQRERSMPGSTFLSQAGGMGSGAFRMAGGGGISGLMTYADGGNVANLGDYSDGGRLLRGPGDGVSDSIPATISGKQPARLADGEFVVPARIVSELGNGSTDAGARKLYAMMERVQKARGKTTGKNKVAANSRADKYLPA